MRFDALKNLIESIKTNYKCPKCGAETNDNSFDILWTAWNNVNLDIICPKCNTHSLFNSQVITMDITNEGMKKLLKWLTTQNIKKISDKEIISLNKDLKKEKINVSDLFE